MDSMCSEVLDGLRIFCISKHGARNRVHNLLNLQCGTGNSKSWIFHLLKNKGSNRDLLSVHPGRLTWNPKMEVGKMIFLFNWVIFRFHVNFEGCTPSRHLSYLYSIHSAKRHLQCPAILGFQKSIDTAITTHDHAKYKLQKSQWTSRKFA